MNSNKANAERTMTETWTTQRGDAVELSFTVYAWAADWTCKTVITFNGKADEYAQFGKVNGFNVVQFNNTSKAVVVSDDIIAQKNGMIQWVKGVIKAGEAEMNEILDAERRADRS